jgi:hypothetical protein
MTDDRPKVVDWRTGRPAYAGGSEANEDVVVLLEKWLERARSGEIVGVAVAALYRDLSTGSNWEGRAGPGLIGEAFSLTARINAFLDAED